MSQVLVAKDKHETYIIDATDKFEAYLELFQMFDANGYYEDLDENPPASQKDRRHDDQVEWLRLARKGIADAARKLLDYRKSRGYEYEDSFGFNSVITPDRNKTQKRYSRMGAHLTL